MWFTGYFLLSTLWLALAVPNQPQSAQIPDISAAIDQQPKQYSNFDTIFVYSSPAALIAAKILSDAGKRVLLISSGPAPPELSRSLYLRPQILTQTNYVKTGFINIPGALRPKKFWYPTFVGGLSEVGQNLWDAGTLQKNQGWTDTSPLWNWDNLVLVYRDIELIPLRGKLIDEGIIPIDRNVRETQTIQHISAALQELGLKDLGSEYRLRDKPGSMMLPLMAEENLDGVQAVVFAEAVINATKNPKNVFLSLNTEIESIDVKQNTAIGVTIKTPSGGTYSIGGQEIIMGGNPGRIAQLLYKAGIGDKAVLDQLGIPTQQHLPAVGKYWSVNIMFTGSLFVFPRGTLKEFGTSDMDASRAFMQGQYTIQTGIFLDQFKAFLGIPEGSWTNVAINFHAFTIEMVERLTALMEGLFQFDLPTQMFVLNLLGTNDILFAMPQIVDTKSFGEIVIKTQSDLNFPPNLNSGIYTNKEDMSVMLQALNFVQSLSKTTTFQNLGAQYVQIPVDECANSRSSQAYNECVIYNLSVPGLHSSGGAVMGTDPLKSVVDEKTLIVHGMKNLYIMNTAVVPNGTGTESVAIDSVIGAFGAELILQPYNN